MSVVLRVGNREIAAEELMPLLAGYQMLPQLLREIIIDEAIASTTCSAEEEIQAKEDFYQKQELATDEAKQAWMAYHRMTPAQMDQLATRELRLEKYKQETWAPKLESYFLSRKGQLDKVIYSLIRVKDLGLAQELYFRILEGEQSFAEAARTYSQGPEAQTDGLIGPVELSVPHPNLAKVLSISQPGQLMPPTRIGEWLVIVRLERFIPAQLDDAMRRRLLNEFFETWLRDQIHQLSAISPNGSTAQSSIL